MTTQTITTPAITTPATTTQATTTRAIYRAVALPEATPPYDRASLKVHYPAAPENTPQERDTGLVPAAGEGAPFPIAILMPGINIGPEGYTWLARGLAAAGIVAVTYTLVAEEMPGHVSLTPGLVLHELTREEYGKRPSATALVPILGELARLNEQGILEGRLDLQRLLLGGHSAGGSVALLNARPDWLPGLRAAFSYAAHTGAATALGYPEDSLFPTPTAVPLLLMGGTRDGCIANSAGRYGGEASPTGRIERTFDEALADNRQDCYLALIDGANHFSLVHPLDDSTGRAFLDQATTRPGEVIRAFLLELITDFARAYVCENPVGDDVREDKVGDGGVHNNIRNDSVRDNKVRNGRSGDDDAHDNNVRNKSVGDGDVRNDNVHSDRVSASKAARARLKNLATLNHKGQESHECLARFEMRPGREART